MREVIKSNFATVPFVVGASLFLCALIFYYFAVLRVDYTKTSLLDLGPHPDATEYFAQAKALGMDGWPSIQIGYEKLPSRYPPGYPVLMLPWLNILPTPAVVLAPFRANQTLGLLLLLAVFTFYAYLAMPITGGFAALLVATLPCFFTFCRSSLSDVSASLLIVLAFMFAYLGVTEERRSKIYLSAILLGLSVNVRLQSAFFGPLLLVMAIWNEFALRPLDYHTANIFGTGTCFVPAFVLLTCAGLFFIRIDRFVTCAVLACSAFLGVILTHNYRLVDARYYLPLLILSIAFAVLPAMWAAKNLVTGRRIIIALPILVLFAAACLGVPSRSGYKTQSIGRCQAWDALHFTTPPHASE